MLNNLRVRRRVGKNTPLWFSKYTCYFEYYIQILLMIITTILQEQLILATTSKKKFLLLYFYLLHKTSYDIKGYAHPPVNNYILCNTEQQRAKLNNPDPMLHHMIVWLPHIEFHQGQIADNPMWSFSFPPLLQSHHLSKYQFISCTLKSAGL